MRLYAFDEVGESLHLVPMAARRALDHAGIRLSLEGWRALPLDRRRAIVTLGSATDVDAPAVRSAAGSGDAIEARTDPAPHAVPVHVTKRFGVERPVLLSVWSALAPVDRYALAKVAEKGREERVAQVYDEIVGASAFSTHVGPRGDARMVDVADKAATRRRAVAESRVMMNADAFVRLERADAPKGDVLGTARIAGIQAAKRTSDAIPLCHPLSLTRVSVDLAPDASSRSVAVRATVETMDRTGVEMEALHAASVAALTIYDMLKAFDRTMEIGPTRLVAKSGGRSGDYER